MSQAEHERIYATHAALGPAFHGAVAWIARAPTARGSRVSAHCRAGRERTAMVVAACRAGREKRGEIVETRALLVAAMRAVAVALVALAATGVRADDLDSLLVPGDVVRTTLVAGEGKTVAVAGLVGSRLSVTVTRVKPGTAQPGFSLADPDGVVLDLGRKLKLSKSAARLRAFPSIYARDAAVDADSATVLVAMVDGSAATYALVDLATMSVLQTFAVAGTSSQPIRNPRVAWSAPDDTFAMSWVRRGSSQEGHVRVCSASDLDTELSSTRVAVSQEVTQVDVDADSDAGGWVAVWEQYAGSTGSQIRAVHVAADGTPDASDHLAFTNASGLAWSPTIVYRGDGTFVVAHGGATAAETDYALRRIVLGADAVVQQGSVQVATSADWYGLFQPEVALDPESGDVLLCFSYLLYDRYRPAFVMLSGAGATPGAVKSRDGEGLLPEGLLDGVVWNPERREFVVGLTTGAGFVSVRRVEPDGEVRVARVPEEYEGIWGVPWSGPSPGQLGLLRAWDGVDDGVPSTSTDEYRVRAGPLY